jgi:hypothetical protein
MRFPILLLTTLSLLVPAAPLLAKPAAKPATPPAVAAASCPYLNSSKDENTSSTEAVYDPATKTLKIQVTRSVPEMFWPIAESMTRERVTKILDQCSTISRINVTFQSGQKMTVERELTAKR